MTEFFGNGETPFPFLFKTDPEIIAGTTFRLKDSEIQFALHTMETPELKDGILKNRVNLIKNLGFKRLITLNQVHSDIIWDINDSFLDNYSETNPVEGDASIAQKRGILLGILTADCIPILAYDLNRCVISAIHAGWKGLFQGIHKKAVIQLLERYFCSPSNIKIILGPHIRSCCYKVGQELIDKFRDPIFVEYDGQYRLDMESMSARDFRTLGIPSENILTMENCTFCSATPHFFSYRKGNVRERNLTFIGLKDALWFDRLTNQAVPK